MGFLEFLESFQCQECLTENIITQIVVKVFGRQYWDFFVGFMSPHTFRAASSIRPLKHPPQSHGARNCQHGRPIKASRKGKPMAPVRGSCLSGGLRLRPLKGLMRPFLHLVLFVFATRWSRLDAAQLLSCELTPRILHPASIRKKSQQAWNKI